MVRKGLSERKRVKGKIKHVSENYANNLLRAMVWLGNTYVF